MENYYLQEDFLNHFVSNQNVDELFQLVTKFIKNTMILLFILCEECFTLFSLSIFSDSLFVETSDLTFSGCKISGVNETFFVY